MLQKEQRKLRRNDVSEVNRTNFLKEIKSGAEESEAKTKLSEEKFNGLLEI